MKSIFLSLSVLIVLFAASCSKNNPAATGRDAFVGNYHMYDSSIYITCQNCGGQTYYDTIAVRYDLQVIALSGTTDRVVFNNIGNGGSDTATVSGTLATFTGNSLNYATSATISGSTLNMTLVQYSGPTVYSHSSGTKF